MRKMMICVSLMLAMVQMWPLVFGQRSVADVATPSAQAAVTIAPPKRIVAASAASTPANVSKSTVPSSCFQQYRGRYARCAKGDAVCGQTANDQWDLCEATGLWPE